MIKANESCMSYLLLHLGQALCWEKNVNFFFTYVKYIYKHTINKGLYKSEAPGRLGNITLCGGA